jgi:hypothetical protein
MADAQSPKPHLSQNPDEAAERREIVEKVIHALQPAQTSALPSPEPGSSSAIQPASRPPWPLQQYFDGEVVLDVELGARFPNMPLMSNIHFRELGSRKSRGVATLSTSDGGAQIVIDADSDTHAIQLSFTYGSMLTLRFDLSHLSDADRDGWMSKMRRADSGVAFLWGAARWDRDYVLCLSHKYFTNIYAFSPSQFDSAARVTSEVTRRLLDWLEGYWKPKKADDQPSPTLLTW